MISFLSFSTAARRRRNLRLIAGVTLDPESEGVAASSCCRSASGAKCKSKPASVKEPLALVVELLSPSSEQSLLEMGVTVSSVKVASVSSVFFPSKQPAFDCSDMLFLKDMSGKSPHDLLFWSSSLRGAISSGATSRNVRRMMMPGHCGKSDVSAAGESAWDVVFLRGVMRTAIAEIQDQRKGVPAPPKAPCKAWGRECGWCCGWAGASGEKRALA